MQHQLPVTEEHTLGQAGGTGGVEGGGPGVLVEIRKVVMRRSGMKQGFVFARKTGRHRIGRNVADEDEGLGRLELVLDFLQHRHELHVHQQYLCLGVVDGVEDLLGRQTHVYGHQHRTHHGNGEVALEVAVAVPVHHSDGVAGTDAERAQGVGELRDTVVQGPIVEPLEIPINDFLVRCHREWRVQQLLDQQRISVCARRRLNEIVGVDGRHDGLLLVFLVGAVEFRVTLRTGRATVP